MIVELHAGHNLFFRSESELERLAAIERAIGRFPISYAWTAESVRPGTFTFQHGTRVVFPSDEGQIEDNMLVVYRVMRTKPYTVLTLQLYSCLCANQPCRQHFIKSRVTHDLIKQMLQHKPEARITMRDAARHRFFAVNAW